MKVKILSQTYGRDHSEETLMELREEMRSMQRLDNIFSEFSHKLDLTGTYMSKRINFDCLKTVMDAYETECGRLTDYGLIYVKYFAESCEIYDSATIMDSIECPAMA